MLVYGPGGVGKSALTEALVRGSHVGCVRAHASDLFSPIKYDMCLHVHARVCVHVLVSVCEPLNMRNLSGMRMCRSACLYACLLHIHKSCALS
jgi:hypothetical protein